MKSLLRRQLLRALARFGQDGGAEAIPALTYHSIDGSGSPISFPAEFCRAQLAWLAGQGYGSLTAREAAAMLAGDQPIAPRRIVLTFDDGFASVRQTAFPLLSEFGFVGTVFCASGYVGKACGWERAASIPAFGMLSWDELVFLKEHGWEIGGHTVSHARLPSLSEEQARQEITEDRRILRERLGDDVVSFAYPYGAFENREAVAVADAGFTSAWTMEPVVNRRGGDRCMRGRFNCDRVRSDSPETAALAAQVCLGGRYGEYALLTARRLRIGGRRRGG